MVDILNVSSEAEESSSNLLEEFLVDHASGCRKASIVINWVALVLSVLGILTAVSLLRIYEQSSNVFLAAIGVADSLGTLDNLLRLSNRWIEGRTLFDQHNYLCRFYGYCVSMISLCKWFFYIILCLDRFTAVLFPYFYRAHAKRKGAIVVVLGLLVVNSLFSIPYPLNGGRILNYSGTAKWCQIFYSELYHNLIRWSDRFFLSWLAFISNGVTTIVLIKRWRDARKMHRNNTISEEQKRRENRNLKASGVLVTMSLTFLLLQWTENFWVDYSVELYKKNLAAYNSSRYMGYIITATNAASNFLFYMCLPSMRQASVQFIKSLLPI